MLDINTPSVTICGSRHNLDRQILENCKEVGKRLADSRYAVLTGGGPGIMKYANIGCNLVDKSLSFGITMLQFEDVDDDNNEIYNPKDILNDNLIYAKTYRERKELLFHNTKCVILYPGGMGTLDEFTDSVAENRNIICVGSYFWNSFKDWCSRNDIRWPDNIRIFDDVDEIINCINNLP